MPPRTAWKRAGPIKIFSTQTGGEDSETELRVVDSCLQSSLYQACTTQSAAPACVRLYVTITTMAASLFTQSITSFSSPTNVDEPIAASILCLVWHSALHFIMTQFCFTTLKFGTITFIFIMFFSNLRIFCIAMFLHREIRFLNNPALALRQ